MILDNTKFKLNVLNNKKDNNMKLLLIISVMALPSALLADEFSDLKKKQVETISKDPFANNKSACVATTARGVRLTETWTFVKTATENKFLKNLGTVLQKGTYSYENEIIKFKQTASVIGMKETEVLKDFEYPVKIVPNGYEYILTNKVGEKLLYSCAWAGSAIQ